jgi:hypothetical protein
MGNVMKRRTLLVAALGAPLAAPSIARAQAAWPNKPVKFICPFAPGGGTDTVSRLISDQLSRILGQTFVVDNKAGAGGNIGTVELARATPDGYTVGLISVASHTINPQLYTKLPYDPDKDIVGVSRLAVLANLLGVTNTLPANNVAELIALCKKEPGKYSFASSGPGSSLHLSGELFKVMAGVDILHIPYKGAGPAYNDVISGTVTMMFANMPSMLPQVKSGHRRDPAGLCRHLVVWPGRTRRHAGADPGQARGRRGRGAEGTGDPEALGRRPRPGHAAARPQGLRSVRGRGPQALVAGLEGLGRQARLGCVDDHVEAFVG